MKHQQYLAISQIVNICSYRTLYHLTHDEYSLLNASSDPQVTKFYHPVMER